MNNSPTCFLNRKKGNRVSTPAFEILITSLHGSSQAFFLGHSFEYHIIFKEMAYILPPSSKKKSLSTIYESTLVVTTFWAK